MAHLQALGDLVRLVDVTGPPAAHVQLLQRHDVGFELRQHRGDAGHVEATVVPDAAMDVVGHDTGHGSWGFCRLTAAAARREGPGDG